MIFVCRTAKQLAMSPADALTWQRLADNSKVVSESIKRLVTSIREQPPGQVRLFLFLSMFLLFIERYFQLERDFYREIS